MGRILFEKTGKAIWISHLDLMRVFQRAFRRADMPLHHSQGFNPHPYVSLVMPLSVGTASHWEVMDYELDNPLEPQEVAERLQAQLPEGLTILQSYDKGIKIKEMTYLQAEISMEYDKGVTPELMAGLTAFYSQEDIQTEKRTKKGPVMTNIKPMVAKWELSQADDNTVNLAVTVCAQNPSLNPQLLMNALPEDLAPDFGKITRTQLQTSDFSPFL